METYCLDTSSAYYPEIKRFYGAKKTKSIVSKNTVKFFLKFHVVFFVIATILNNVIRDENFRISNGVISFMRRTLKKKFPNKIRRGRTYSHDAEGSYILQTVCLKFW